MIRAAILFGLAIAALGCGSDRQSSMATSATDRPDPVPTVTAPVAASTSAQPVASPSGEPAAPANAAGDPMALIGGGMALEKLPTRAVSPNKNFEPGLRQRLMAPPP